MGYDSLIVLYHHSIPAFAQTIRTLPPLNTSARRYSYLRRSFGFTAVATCILTLLSDFVNQFRYCWLLCSSWFKLIAAHAIAMQDLHLQDIPIRWHTPTTPTARSALPVLFAFRAYECRYHILNHLPGACSCTPRGLPIYHTQLSSHAADMTPGKQGSHACCRSPLYQPSSKPHGFGLPNSTWRCCISFAFAAACDFADEITSHVPSLERMYPLLMG